MSGDPDAGGGGAPSGSAASGASPRLLFPAARPRGSWTSHTGPGSGEPRLRPSGREPFHPPASRHWPRGGTGILRAGHRTAIEPTGPSPPPQPTTMRRPEARFAVVDLFAGAGGLGEGFASYTDPTGHRPYRLRLSVENDPDAWASLYFRHFLRRFPDGFPDEYYAFLNGDLPEPAWAQLFPRETASARDETLRLELGKPATTKKISAIIERLRRTHGSRTILLGGPPCQGYSLVGRARNSGRLDYDADDDPRLTLYRHYCRVLGLLAPAAFVMENVKGILSASRRGKNIFATVCRDLEKTSPGYTLCPLAAEASNPENRQPADFIVRAEDHGVPQARHRVIVVGIRNDLLDGHDGILDALRLSHDRATPVSSVLDGMPILRSHLSRGLDTPAAWLETIRSGAKALLRPPSPVPVGSRTRFDQTVREALATIERRGGSPPARRIGVGRACSPTLRNWIVDSRVRKLPNNEARGHMPSDVQRYFFAAIWAAVHDESPKARDFPAALAPEHGNWTTGTFVDRFRVQLKDRPARTVTSHISRDGHYYIHPDPSQARSLTVREAARLQTFPDNFLFRGPRTAQYRQVGNAVPPLLSHHLAESLWRFLRRATRTRSRRAVGQPVAA